MTPMGGTVTTKDGKIKDPPVVTVPIALVEQQGRQFMAELMEVKTIKGELKGRYQRSCTDCEQKGMIHQNGVTTFCPCSKWWLV